VLFWFLLYDTLPHYIIVHLLYNCSFWVIIQVPEIMGSVAQLDEKISAADTLERNRE